MESSRPVIIEVALNGGTTKLAQPHTPITVDEIIGDALECIDAGASIVHQHDEFAAFPDKQPRSMAELSARVYREVRRQHPTVLMYPTANGYHLRDGVKMWEHNELLAEEGLIDMALLDPGAVLLWRHTEQGGVGRGILYGYSPRDIEHIAARCRALRLAPNIACFEPGYVRVVAAYLASGMMPDGAFVKFYFGTARQPFGLPASDSALDTYLDLLAGASTTWAVAVLGDDTVRSGMARAAIERGGHVRVGLEDYEGERSPRNAELVAEAADLVRSMGHTVATPEETRKILGIGRGLAA